MRNIFILAIVAALGGGSGTWVNTQFNPGTRDRFTATDAEKLEMRLKEFWVAALELHIREQKIENRELEYRIKSNLPPYETRQRISAIEQHLMRLNEGFEVPTQKWQDFDRR